ncbi:MAG: AmmeMemoRadiSam system protein B [Candidatus Rokubacteria bacterium]|nr:AmmeMemoRadiSam system protein B [Candidatus Rokubacteria bacterium]
MSSESRPRLRAVEAIPVEHEGETMIALRDPAGYTPSVLLFPGALVEILAQFDGTHALIDIQADILDRHGEMVPRDQLEKIEAALDEHGFLDSPRFAERRAAIDGAFLAAPRRPAAHAGGAYAGAPAELRRTMDGFFTHVHGPGPIAPDGAAAPAVTGLIAPHIDFHRGGAAYAWAYRELAERGDADLFVIFGTCHAGMADPFALTRKDYDTPLGPARVDRDVIERLAKRAQQDCFGSELAHRAEHSIEFQAVFLQYLFAGRRDVTIVPVLASFAHEAMLRGRGPEDDPRVPRFLDALVDTLGESGRRAVIVAGADLAHMGPRFGDPELVSDAERARIEREDRAMLEPVAAANPRAFFDVVAGDRDRRRICGYSPIYATVRTLTALGGNPRGVLRRYAQSDDPQGVVSFASMVF